MAIGLHLCLLEHGQTDEIQKDEQTNGLAEFISTYKLCWKLLKILLSNSRLFSRIHLQFFCKNICRHLYS